MSSSASATPSPSATATIKPSDNLDAITVSGAYSKKPTVKIKAPFAIDRTRVKVLKQGKGTKVPSDGFVDVLYHGSIGRTGKVFQEVFGDHSPVAFPLDGVVPGFKKGLENQRIGSRVLIAMPGADGYDASGGNEQAGIQVGDTLVFVVDILEASVSGPTGKAIPAPAGMPRVTVSNGKPSIALPAANPPAKMQVAALTAGTGRKVEASDTIVCHYLGVSWKTGKVIDEQYSSLQSGLLSSTIPGWQKALVGKKIGQRVLMVLPPADGYPQGSNNPPVQAGDTVVYVVDILFSTTQ